AAVRPETRRRGSRRRRGSQPKRLEERGRRGPRGRREHRRCSLRAASPAPSLGNRNVDSATPAILRPLVTRQAAVRAVLLVVLCTQALVGAVTLIRNLPDERVREFAWTASRAERLHRALG